MQSCCDNTILVQILQDTVKKCRNLCCVASLFMNYLILHRLRGNQPIPAINQDFVYAVFCQLIDRGGTAPQWVKDRYQEFRPLLNQQLHELFYRPTAMITTFARGYATNFANHISTNFERRTTDYFFVRFNDESDDWFLAGVSVASRRKFAAYAYNKSATGEGNWPTIRDNPFGQDLIDNFVSTIDLGPTPVTIQSLEAHGNQYLPWLYQVLQRLESRVIIQELVPQDFASKSYIHRKLKEFCRGIFIPTKLFESLKHGTYQAIKHQGDVIHSTSVLQYPNIGPNLRTAIDDFVQETIDAIEAGTFAPEKYTDPAGSRQFTFAPIYSWQFSHIQLDKYTLPPILRSAGIQIHSTPSDEQLLDTLWRYFNFAAIGFHRQEDLHTNRLKFCNILRTDGIDLEFLFDKTATTKADLATPATFQHWTNFASHRTTIWGVDTGINDVFVAADGIDEEPHRYRKLSSKEYYHLCGFNKAAEKRRRWKLEDGELWRQLLDDMPTVKTSNSDQLLDAIRHPHNSEQSAIRRDFWTPILPMDFLAEDNLQHYIIAFGKTSFGNMRGKKPGPVKSIFRHLCYLSRIKNNISVVAMDEYLTSQVCANCDRRTLKHVRERRNPGRSSGLKLHTLLNCETCSKVWNRDQMASKNIKYIFEYMANHNNERPQQFRRPAGEPPPNVEE
ncbi:unnamed protein product [Umbelopsis ramanniana]